MLFVPHKPIAPSRFFFFSFFATQHFFQVKFQASVSKSCSNWFICLHCRPTEKNSLTRQKPFILKTKVADYTSTEFLCACMLDGLCKNIFRTPKKVTNTQERTTNNFFFTRIQVNKHKKSPSFVPSQHSTHNFSKNKEE